MKKNNYPRILLDFISSIMRISKVLWIGKLELSMSKLFDLQGKTILVTGASRGIGFSIAEALAQHNAKVILNSRDESALK